MVQIPYLKKVEPSIVVSVSKGAVVRFEGMNLLNSALRFRAAGKTFTGVRIYNDTVVTALAPQPPLRNPTTPQTTYPIELSFDHGVSYYRTIFSLTFQQNHAVFGLSPRVAVYRSGVISINLQGYFNFEALASTTVEAGLAELRRNFRLDALPGYYGQVGLYEFPGPVAEKGGKQG